MTRRSSTRSYESADRQEAAAGLLQHHTQPQPSDISSCCCGGGTLHTPAADPADKGGEALAGGSRRVSDPRQANRSGGVSPLCCVTSERGNQRGVAR